MSSNSIEIVLVEDNPNDAELIVRALRKHNLANKIVVYKDGAEAIEFLCGPSDAASAPPRVVFLDLKLPKVDGLEVLRRMRSDQRTRDIPVVMLSSSDQDRDIDTAYRLGANSFVTKPIKFEAFAKVVAELGIYWLLLNVPPRTEPM